ncbi:MAG: ABC transporter substrate-binding protein [Rhodoferax sp.]|nr:ABC transporter substrate-binding protein [Rhodoferax sp.]
MTSSRRSVLTAGVAAAALVGVGVPHLTRAQARPPRQARMVPHGDLNVLDPIWTTQNMAAYHGAMMYDTLYGIDANFVPQPQMVGKTDISADRKTYTMELRPGLKWHDGTAVTARDCVASLRRWQAKDGAGQHLFERVADTPVVDEKTFRIVLKEPYGLLLDALAKTSTPLCVMMKAEIAATDPNTQITKHIGSGPFKFIEAEYRPGSRVVYERNPDYVPRSEPASGIAGGKRVMLDRVIWDIMPDAQTAASALMAGEVDFFEVPPIDILPALSATPGVKVEVFNKLGNIGQIRLNHLHPPFNNLSARKAAQLAISQEDIQRAAVGDPKYYRTCGSNFTCGSAMGVEDGSDALMLGAPMAQRQARARELLKESGYDGRPIVLLHATNIHVMNQTMLVVAQNLRQIGLNVQLASTDWGAVVTRRSNQNPPDQGGWNVFYTYSGGNSAASPISLFAHAAIGRKGWFGWPENPQIETMRNEWAAASTLDARKAVASRMNRTMIDYVHDIKTGQWVAPVAYRSDRLRNMVQVPEVVPWWNVERFA